MTEKKRLVFIILGKLSILENEENQSTVNLISEPHQRITQRIIKL